MEIILRKDAKKLGLTHYFTGVPCKHGHINIREVKKGRCMSCCKMHAMKDYKKDIEKSREKARKKYHENPEVRRKLALKYREENIDVYNARARDWRSKNKEKMKSLKAKRRTLIIGNTKGDHYTAQDAKRIKKQQGGKCLNCKADLGDGGHIDHITPLARGGENTKYNIQWLCATCNMRKNRKDPIVWAQENGRLL
jgi:5-methylcytosine-specific restriction endonuclease McrA